MSWNKSDETVVAGTGEVYVAPVGTPLPATADAALNAAFIGLGYHSEDGVTVNKNLEITEFRAWQSRHPIRRERETEDFQLSYNLLQWNEETIPLAFGGGEILDLGGGQFRYSPPADGEDLDERTLVCDVDDGPRRVRFVIPRGSITEGAESQFQRTEMATLAVTFKSLEPLDTSDPYYFLFNDDGAFAPGS